MGNKCLISGLAQHLGCTNGDEKENEELHLCLCYFFGLDPQIASNHKYDLKDCIQEAIIHDLDDCVILGVDKMMI